jgi:hypothetical protein
MIGIALGDGAWLSVDVSPLDRQESAAELPLLNLGSSLGAVVVVQRGYVREGEVLRIACVRAPSDRWAPGVEGLVLDRATALAKRTMVAIDEWSASTITPVEDRFEQTLVGRGEQKHAAIRHVLGFVGQDHAALLCTTTCSSPKKASCIGRVEQTRALGAFVEPPPVHLWVQSILLVANRPYEMAVIGAFLTMMLVGLILWRRPRPRQ